jgi:all-trans-8'-apo-beta-carotenal 15,15'-oxygenase
MSTLDVTTATTTGELGDIPKFHGGLENLEVEQSYWVDEVEGTIPADLRGTFLRNGPGRQQIGGQKFGHWFDGDGMISAFSFVDGRAHFKNSYVKTPKYLTETAEQRIAYRGFGTAIPGGLRRNAFRPPANPANTNLVLQGNKLLALNEGGRPWELRPDTLETVGEYFYDGELTNATVFSAHPKRHPGTGDLYNFGAGMLGFGRKGPKPGLHLYRIDARGQMIRKGELPLDTFPFCHDFVISDRYAIFFINSIVFGRMADVALGRCSIADAVAFDPTIEMRVEVVELETFAPVASFRTEPGAVIHFGNAFSDGDELVVDGMFADDFDVNSQLSDMFNATKLSGGRYRRYRLNLASGSHSYEERSDHESEFPTFNNRWVGRPNSATFSACSVDNGHNSFFNGFQRVDDTGSTLVTLEPGLFGSEPLFAPAVGGEAEDDGYLLVVVYNAFDHRSELHIHRADDITERVAKLSLPHHLPHQFHGYFHDEVLLRDAR